MQHYMGGGVTTSGLASFEKGYDIGSGQPSAINGVDPWGHSQ